MAGHKFSGYISRLWQALFAAFARLFRRIFPFLPRNNTSSQPPPPAISAVDQADTQHSSAPTSDPQSNTASQLRSPPDLERGQPQPEGEAMAASKKRGGNKRSGAKPTGAQPATATSATTADQRDKENLEPGRQLSQPTTPSAPAENSKTPLGTSNLAGNIDSRANSQQPDGQGPASSHSAGKHSGRPAPIATHFDDAIKKEGPAPGRETPNTVSSQDPVTTAVTLVESKFEIQKAGSHSRTGTETPGLAPKPTTTRQNAAPSGNTQAGQVTSAIDRLSLDDSTPGPEKALTKDTAAVESAGVPVVVVNPVPGQPLVALKPLAPLVTPPSQVLPGLIEPDTEEGKRERAIHLNFMREALKMVSVSAHQAYTIFTNFITGG